MVNVRELILKYIQGGYTKMKVVITHIDMSGNVRCIRYFIVKGSGMTETMTFYDYTFFTSSRNLTKTSYQLFYWELDDLKKYFSIYN